MDADEITKVLSEHRICWGTSMVGSFYAYCTCPKWSATLVTAGEVQVSHDTHLATVLAPLVEQARQEGAREALTEFADRFRPGDGNPWALHVRARARRAAEWAVTPGSGTAGGGS